MNNLMHNSTVAQAPTVARSVRGRVACDLAANPGYFGAATGGFWTVIQDTTKQHHSQRRKRF